MDAYGFFEVEAGYIEDNLYFGTEALRSLALRTKPSKIYWKGIVVNAWADGELKSKTIEVGEVFSFEIGKDFEKITFQIRLKKEILDLISSGKIKFDPVFKVFNTFPFTKDSILLNPMMIVDDVELSEIKLVQIKNL